MKEVMAVYDQDICYAKRFADFVNSKADSYFQVIPFSELESLESYADSNPFSMLLLGQELDLDALAHIKTRDVIRLGELGCKIEPGETVIHKYQSVEQILRDVMLHCQTYATEVETVLGPNCRIIGVYSPVHGCGKTSFALTLAQILAKSQKVLFLTLEYFTGFEMLFACQYQKGLSDVLYQWKSQTHNPFVLGSTIHYLGELSYIPPVSYPEDLKLFSGEEVKQLLEKLAKEAGYEVLVVDFGEMGEAIEALQSCQILYVPTKDDIMSKMKLDSWKEYLAQIGAKGILNKAKFLKLPCVKVEQGTNYLETLLWGEMGDYIRCEMSTTERSQ